MLSDREQLRYMIDDVQSISQEMLWSFSDWFNHALRDRVYSLQHTIQEYYESGKLSHAYYETEKLIDLLEELEIIYSHREKSRDHVHIDTTLQDDLSLVMTHPERINDERIWQLEQMRYHLQDMDVIEESWAMHIMYPTFDWLEVLLLVSIISYVFALEFGLYSWNVHWSFISFLALLCLFIYFLRQTRYWFGLLVFLVLVLLLSFTFWLL